ncbi:unnamed protein product [Trifolium pratense]|uniref:Uncharacterized protein n=1 Tax=Trifolium pratense TaxID=57577 RepID=A0ACB0JNQ3_TRIPR|nr:unnamed protein product [Trifolium pratense]
MPAVQELHKLDSQDLCRLLKDAGNFSVHYRQKGVLLEKQACANVPIAAVDGVAAVAKRLAPKPAVQKKVTAKPKPVEVIEISDEKDSEDKTVHKKKEADTLNLMLAVQELHKLDSQDLCRLLKDAGNFSVHYRTGKGVLLEIDMDKLARYRQSFAGEVIYMTNKPKEIVDIDAGDANNELAAVEYLEDIYKFYKIVENENRPHDYMNSQPEINAKMRAILIDWLVDLHTKFQLSPKEALYLTINIVDRFLAVKLVPRRELQLVGISAMLMASKYEEIWPPEVNDFVTLSDYAYTHEQIRIMEKTILGKLEWTLTVPTPFAFLVRFIKAASASVSSVSGVPSVVHERNLHDSGEILTALWGSLCNYDLLFSDLVFCNVLHSWKLYTVPLVLSGSLFPLMQWTRRAQFVVVIVQTLMRPGVTLCFYNFSCMEYSREIMKDIFLLWCYRGESL